MLSQFSTDDFAPQLRVAAWRDFYAEKIYRVTLDPAPSSDNFRAGARGHVCGDFALFDVQAKIEGFQRTGADVARDRKDAVHAWRLRRPMRYNALAGRSPREVEYEPGDFCIQSAEWSFDAVTLEGVSYEMLVIPIVAISPILPGGRLPHAVRALAASPLGALLAAAFDAANAQAPQLPDRLAACRT